jgi:hypothetical protein
MIFFQSWQAVRCFRMAMHVGHLLFVSEGPMVFQIRMFDLRNQYQTTDGSIMHSDVHLCVHACLNMNVLVCICSLCACPIVHAFTHIYALIQPVHNVCNAYS